MKLFNKQIFLLTVILLIGVFLRFYKLDFGQGYFSHPDEYHLAIAVSKLSFPTQMNPHFFSYGTVSIYLIYFSQQLMNFLFPHSLIANSFLIGRFFSAFSSTLTLIFIYLISKQLMSQKWALVAIFLGATLPGLIQQAHFATPESTLIFFLFGSLYCLINFNQTGQLKNLFFASFFFGLGLGTKVSTITFAVVFLAGIFLKKPFSLKKASQNLLFAGFVILLTLVITSPFIFLDWQDFANNIQYEGSLAIGKQLVFYTRQFIDTKPVLFQLEKIYPYALGPALLLLGMIGIFYAIACFITDKTQKSSLPLITLAFFSLFLPNVFLFTKWTRFISPTFPFFAIFSAFLISKISKFFSHSINLIFYFTFFVLSVLWSLAFFSIYLNPDVRVEASSWLEENLPQGSTILVEGGNTLDLPLHGSFLRASLDFYSLDDNPKSLPQVRAALAQSDYFIIESRRVFFNHQRLAQLYPQTARFYQELFKGKLGFQEIKEFHSFPRLNIGNLSLEIPDENAEETWSVFDHPVIRVYQKIKSDK